MTTLLLLIIIKVITNVFLVEGAQQHVFSSEHYGIYSREDSRTSLHGYTPDQACITLKNARGIYASVHGMRTLEKSQTVILPTNTKRTTVEACFLYNSYSYIVLRNQSALEERIILRRGQGGVDTRRLFLSANSQVYYDHIAQRLYVVHNHTTLYEMNMRDLEALWSEERWGNSRPILKYYARLPSSNYTDLMIADNGLYTIVDGMVLKNRLEKSAWKLFGLVPLTEDTYHRFASPPVPIGRINADEFHFLLFNNNNKQEEAAVATTPPPMTRFDLTTALLYLTDAILIVILAVCVRNGLISSKAVSRTRPEFALLKQQQRHPLITDAVDPPHPYKRHSI